MRIIQAQTTVELDAVRELFGEYQRGLGVDLGFQGFAEELATLPGRYAPPSGRLLLALEGTDAAGCVALRALEDEVCEMKRLFVRPAWRGQGLGFRLAMQIVNEASDLRYAVMRLDTLEGLESAMRMYAAMGFQRRIPYYANPLPGVVYWERALQRRQDDPAMVQSPDVYTALR